MAHLASILVVVMLTMIKVKVNNRQLPPRRWGTPDKTYEKSSVAQHNMYVTRPGPQGLVGWS